MIFSEESSRAIFEMGNVDLIESKKTSTKCPSCLQHVFEGTTTCTCGKWLRPNKNVMDRIKAAFEALKALYYRTSPTITRGCKCGPNPWQQHHHNAREALRSATKGDRKYISIWDRWWNDEAYRTSQLAHNWTDAWVRYSDFIVHIDISHNAPSWQRERYINLVHLRDLDRTSKRDHYCANFVCSVTRSTTAEFQHNDMMMRTNVQNDLRLEMALESMWICLCS